MNTQNVNTAVSESGETGGNSPSVLCPTRKTSALIRLAKAEGNLMMYRAFERLGIEAPDAYEEIFAPQEAAHLVAELTDMGGITSAEVYDMVCSVERLACELRSPLWQEEFPEKLPELAVFQARSTLTVIETHTPRGRGIHFCNHALLSGSNYNLWFPLDEQANLFQTLEQILVWNGVAVNVTRISQLHHCEEYTDHLVTFNPALCG